MCTLIVASTNPVKVQATLNGFRKIFPGDDFQVHALSAPSGVPDQPMSDRETLQGALNRASYARERVPQADYWIGIEGGVEIVGEEMFTFAWIVIASRYGSSKARTGTFLLPPALAQLVQQGMELGVADDLLFKRSNSKQENGTIGVLTDNVIDRMMFYEQAVILACVPLKKQDLYVHKR